MRSYSSSFLLFYHTHAVCFLSLTPQGSGGSFWPSVAFSSPFISNPKIVACTHECDYLTSLRAGQFFSRLSNCLVLTSFSSHSHVYGMNESSFCWERMNWLSKQMWKFLTRDASSPLKVSKDLHWATTDLQNEERESKRNEKLTAWKRHENKEEIEKYAIITQRVGLF